MTSLARRAHPFTVGAVALAVVPLAIVLPAPVGTAVLYGAVCLLAILTGAGRGVWLGLGVVAPLWVMLFVMHALLGAEGERVAAPWGGTLSAAGLELALSQGLRLAAIITASLAFAAVFDPHRFLQAAIAKRWSFGAAFLVVATLDAASRFTEQARRLREAQRTRGLRVKGSLAVRARAIPALVFPLMLASITEADDHALALETRGLTRHGARTAIDPPNDSAGDRAARWLTLLAVVATITWRVMR